eukprot:1363335-Prymnesium_polylepis.1
MPRAKAPRYLTASAPASATCSSVRLIEGSIPGQRATVCLSVVELQRGGDARARQAALALAARSRQAWRKDADGGRCHRR